MIKEGHDILKLDTAVPDNQGLKTELESEYGGKCGTPFFIDGATGNQVCGFREKDVLEKWAKGEEIPAPPRPKSPPPKLPFHGSSEKEIKEWKKLYETWKVENSHLPNLQPAETILARINNPNGQVGEQNQPPQQVIENFGDMKQEISSLKSEVSKLQSNMLSLMNHLGVKHT